MNAVIYARYSSDSQREESIEGQLRECREYAERNNMTIVGTYIDRALSAKTADRPEFQHMIKDSAKELFEIVLVWKLDRFSRDRYDSAHYKHILKKNGVKVISAKEHISEGPEGIILEAMLEGYAEFYSAELSEKIHRGQKENALKGKNNGGGVPLGYLLDKKAQKLAIDPTTAPLVVEVFEKYADGKSVRSIVEDFNARGLRTKKGQPFNINSFSSLLKNRKYIGEYRYQDVVIEGGVPAIVPEELFNRVQERMEKNRHAPAMAKAKEDYLLTTKLFCGKCERMMVGESGKSHTGAMHYYYKCSGAKRLKDCDKKAVRKDWIERVVVRLTMQRVMDEEKINRLIDAILVMQEQEDITTPALRSQLAETESSIGNILKAIEQGIFTPSTKQRLDELEARKEEILANIQTAELQKPKLTREQMTAWFEQFRHGDPANRDFQKRLIDTFVNAVYVFDDKLVLTYNYQHGTQTISLDEIESALSSDFDGATPPKIKAPLCGAFIFGLRSRGARERIYSMVRRKSSQALSTALPMCCMVRPTQVFMDLCRGETAMPTAAPSTMPAPIPHQNAVFSISLTLLFAQRQYAPCAAKKSEIALLKSAIAVIIFLKSDKKRGSLMTTIYLIRHAEADGNLYRRAHGWYDSVITDRGYRQIAALAKRFENVPFDAVYSSDRRRTMTTALSVYKTHGLPLVTTPRVREIGIGVWEDHPWAELERTDGEQLERFNTDAAHWHVAGGEYLPDVRERMIGALREIAEAHPNGTAAVFSHGMAIRLTVGTLQGLSLHEIDGTGHAENTAVSRLEYENGAFRVAYRDDASHLENGLQTLKRQAWLKNARGFEGGIYYVPSGAEGHFDVCRAEETVGAVSVDKCENGLATIGEFWLENDVQGLGFGQQLVGQALSYARAHGCERLSTGRIAKSNALGLRCAQEWGFTQTGEGADWLEFQKNFEYDEESCWKKLQEVIEKEK